jgi:hypothetical protein
MSESTSVTIPQLPAAAKPSANDIIPISQQGIASGLTYGQLEAAIGTGGASGPITQNAQIISTNTTIATGYNALSLGPVEIAQEITVEIPIGSTWRILK